MMITVLTIIVVAAGLVWHMLPALSRPGLSFGVTVRADFSRSPDGKRILRRYWRMVWIGTGAAVGFVLGASAVGVPLLIIIPVVIVFQLIAYNVLTARAHHETARHAVAADATRDADLGRRPALIPGGAITAILPFVLFAGILAYTYVSFDALPERFPIHWGPTGPDRWVERSPQSVFGLLMALVLVCLALSAVIFGIARAMRRVHVRGLVGEAELQDRRRSILVLLALQYALLVPAVLPFVSSDGLATRIALFWGLGIGLVIVWALMMAFRSGQGGSRAVHASLMEADQPSGDRTPDSCWKWGMFYYNPDDPSLIVEKRFGLGQTLNFANRWSWVVLALLATPLVLLVIFVR